MLRTAPRQLLQHLARPLAPSQRIGVIRYQSTAVPRRSFKNGLARWAIAVGGTYWYLTSPIFNDEPSYVVQNAPDAKIQTIASLKPSSKVKPPNAEDAPLITSTPSSNSPPSINPKSPDPNGPGTDVVDPEAARSLEEEASSQGAFNEETGEINWDCPCLGGMAYGPCGTEFREAFSCFVYSKEEPKGMDCIDKFELMQGCFREHPEIYADEISDDERIAEAVQSEKAQEEGTVSGKPDGPEVDQPSVWTPLPEENKGSRRGQPSNSITSV